jgi:hypothetical protein
MTIDYAPRSMLVVRRSSCFLPTFLFVLCGAMMAASLLFGRSPWHIYEWQGNVVQREVDGLLARGIRCCWAFLLLSAGVVIRAAIRRDVRGCLVVGTLLIGSGVMLAYAVGIVSPAYE